jgi:G:T-mismatch repair DNA endonuclease (very short patch repair protein)
MLLATMPKTPVREERQTKTAYWEPKLARNAERDRAVVEELRRLGIRSLRLWDHELGRDSIEEAMGRVKRAAARPPFKRASGGIPNE